MGKILTEEFMIPMNLTAYKLAQSIHVPTSRIQDILHNRRKITADTSIRLGRFSEYLIVFSWICRMILKSGSWS